MEVGMRAVVLAVSGLLSTLPAVAQSAHHNGFGNIADLTFLGNATVDARPNASFNWSGEFGCMSNGDVWTMGLVCNASGLSVQGQDGGDPVDNIYTQLPISLATYSSGNNTLIGLTFATRGGWENRDILTRQDADVPAPSPVPEEPSYVLLGVGLLCIGGLIRRRRR